MSTRNMFSQLRSGMRAIRILSRDSSGIRAGLSHPVHLFTIGDEFSRLLPICRRNVQNHLETLEFLVSLREATLVHFRSGLVLDCIRPDQKLLLTLLGLCDHGVSLVGSDENDPFSWKVLWPSKTIVTPQKLTFDIHSVDPTIFSETFLYDVHFLGFDLADKVVVDLGAFVGDTALYYAHQGARVYAYEPNPTNYSYLLTNLTLNPHLSSRVKSFNKAAGIDGKIMLSEGSKCCGASRAISGPEEKGMRPIEVESRSLDTILKENGIDAPYLLKADCKGCEIELVKQNAISLFKHVKIEYTLSGRSWRVSDLLHQLGTKGFTKFRVFKHNYSPYDTLVEHGTLLATK
jgi:FkbM family methyltransferase